MSSPSLLPIEYQPLGHTDVLISSLGLGTMSLGLSGRPLEREAIATIHQALALGITYFDTADSYCQDESDQHYTERLVCKALQQYEGDTSQVVIGTKGGCTRPQGQWVLDGNPDRIRKTIQESFQALGGEKPIDLWYYHRPDPNYPIQESLYPVREAVAEGSIRYVGLSNFTFKQIQLARDIVEVVALQHQFNPWHRDPEIDGVLEYCEQEQLTLISYCPFGGVDGVRRKTSLQSLTTFVNLAEKKGVSVYCLILAWLRAKSSVIVPIPGAIKPSEIQDSARYLSIKLSQDEMDELDHSVPFGFGRQGLDWLKFQVRKMSGTLKP